MIKARINQGLTYLFGKYNSLWEVEISKTLDREEFEIYKQMSRYDKIHGYKIFKMVMENKALKNEKNYLKLGLLHDCGKEKIGLMRRIKKVLMGDKKLSKHEELGFEKLKKINLELAKLCREHHSKNCDDKMKIFQEIDDR